MRLFVAFALAVIPPTLLAYNVSPSVTLLNQLLAVAAWGGCLALTSRKGAVRQVPWALIGALAVTTLLIVWAMQNGLPSSIGLCSLALMGCGAALALESSSTPAAQPAGPDADLEFHGAVLLAGALSTGIAFIQVFMPGWADGEWIARSGLPGRAVGNLRQPNHLSSLLLWAMIAWVPVAGSSLVAKLRFGRLWATALAALLLWAVVLTASRTGIVGVGLLMLWGLIDRRLARWVRVTLAMAPVAYLLMGFGMSAWAHSTGHTFGGEMRLAEGDMSASRFGIWANTLDLIRASPWMGVGFGEFNFAWTLTPFPGRPVAFFDHTHNLLLQLWVELGIPLGSLVSALLLWALVQAGTRSCKVSGVPGASARAAFMMVLMIGVHSLFEYPLWYAYFLLPTAWAWGHALRLPQPELPPSPAKPRLSVASRIKPHHLLRLTGVVMVLGSLYALYDYRKVVVIYAPTADAGPLPERIEQGQTSLFFAHHADYAAATTSEPPSSAMGAFNTTTHSLLDTRLMLAWANALNESGHRDKASYLAARLREFRNSAAADFFADCQDAAKMAQSLPPFQCVAPPPGLSWRDFQTVAD